MEIFDSTSTLNFFQTSYKDAGFDAQRKYPNEEFCRFMGRNFFKIPVNERQKFKILDVGCGSGSNLFLIARESYYAIGLDLSNEAIILSKQMLAKYNSTAKHLVSSMTNIELEDNYLDGVVDVFSSHCLNTLQSMIFLKELYRVLKIGGRFFSYFPSKNSDTWKLEKTNLIDKNTLNGLTRKDGPFYGNSHPFRFLYPYEYEILLKDHGFDVTYCETINRTYRSTKENFELVVIEAIKKS